MTVAFDQNTMYTDRRKLALDPSTWYDTVWKRQFHDLVGEGGERGGKGSGRTWVDRRGSLSG